jgi:anti-sigma factor (TIGR02949 family)
VTPAVPPAGPTEPTDPEHLASAYNTTQNDVFGDNLLEPGVSEHSAPEDTVTERSSTGHPTSEHPDTEHPDTEHPDTEHPDTEHNEFDCSRARLKLYEYLDGEMAPDDCTRIREHLAQCAPCLQEYDLDQMLKALVRRSCSSEAAPMQLRMQIMSHITTFKMTIEIRD